MTPAPLSLAPLFARVARLDDLTGHDPLRSAALAQALGEPELARALLARSGGLLDHADALKVLNQPLPDGLLARAHAELGPAPALPQWTASEREMFIRGLAGYLLAEQPEAQLQPASTDSALAPGLWILPALPDTERWQAGLECLGQGPVTWAGTSWGSRWGLTTFLTERGLPGTVESTEQLIATLSAVWSWNLPRLPELLSRPLLIDGLHSLPQARLNVVTQLLQDAASVFGWTVIGLPGVERAWPAAFQPLPWPPADIGAATPTRPPRTPLALDVQPVSRRLTLPGVARELAQQQGDILVVLPSRASAARLAGLVEGATLLSTSLCPVHLGQQANELLMRRRRGERALVVATTLPSSVLGTFDQVWHLPAPLPYLAEAAALCSGTFRVLPLLDVAVPQAWNHQWQLTLEMLDAMTQDGDAALSGRARQQAYHAALNASRAEQLPPAHYSDLRASLQYASLAAELGPRAENSVPVLIPWDSAAQQVIGTYRDTGWLSIANLRYAAWLTPSEAWRAIRRGEAEAGGWALIWTAPYHPVYGLAAEAVLHAQAPD
ncbi:hypothetical protein [Deinococcus aerophilus]|uniref:Uncharacterized protein n=1 Tax=Deinococcus aerophilus TaxID=522488 RepID=A0ABQ2GJM5_9DEIO|nr:hypothetical protein [Deinococcus aerophilus]GGL98400.1 hypothetical protein GCM10010841_03520 [Deinococcus aerophilus]